MDEIKKPNIDEVYNEISTKAIDQYLSYIREKSASIPPQQKLNLIKGLEALIDSVSNPEILSGEIAKQIRIQANLERSELCRQLGIEKKTAVYIEAYENGRIKNPRLTKVHGDEHIHKYFLWLKEKGYNPYKL